MRKRLVALCLAAVLAVLVIVPTALATTGHRHMKGKHKFQLNGVVVSTTPATDTTPGTMVVKVKSGTWTVKKFRTKELTLTVSPTARMIDATVDPAAPATLDAFIKDARVHIGGKIDRTDPANPVFTATKLILQKLPAPVPTP
jgi:hypothetical protein